MVSGQRPNRRLRLQRRLRGWSQEDVAAGLHRLAAELEEPELGVDATMVSRWERGTRKPRPRYVRLLCRLFELSADQLGVVEDPEPPAPLGHPQGPLLEDDDVERRDFIHKVGALLGVVALPASGLGPAMEPWERLARALSRPGAVDDETVGHMERVTVELLGLRQTDIDSVTLLGSVTGHLDALTHLLQGPLPPGLRSRLCSLAGETAGIAGWLCWNMDDPRGAAAYFRTGLEAAGEAGDRQLGAFLMGSAACKPPYRENPQDRLRQLREGTRGFLQSDASPATRVWLAAKEADAHALMGGVDGCLRALDRAEHALARVDAAAEAARPRFVAINANWLAGERGASLAKLGRPGEARAILLPVLASLGPRSERDRLWLSTALASTYIQDAEPDEACRVASATLQSASRLRLEPVIRIVQGLRRELLPYRDRPAVRALDEQLRATTGARAAS